MKKFDFEELRAACAGQWRSIIQSLSVVDISDAITTGKHVHCHLGHGDRKKNFRVFKNFDETGGGICTCGAFADGFTLLGYLNGWDRKKAVKEVANFLEGRGYTPRQQAKKPRPPRKKTFSVDEDNTAALQKVWSGTVPLKGTPAERYLRKRGIDGEVPTTKDVRFHPSLHYWDDDNEVSLGYHPALVSLLRSAKSGYPLSIHRIYLTDIGDKADVPKVKKLMSCSIDGAISELGAAIRPYKLSGLFMGITEGLETAAAVHSAHPGLPVWASYSAQVLTNFRPPFGIKGVHIFGDLDSSGTGQVAATRLALRLEKYGLRARLCLPMRSVCLPSDKSHWFTREATRSKIVDRLAKDGYEIADSSPNLDWLDVYASSRDELVNALRNRSAA